MANLGPHAFFILASYAAVAFTIITLIGWLVVRGRRLKARLAELERQGLRRGARGTISDVEAKG